MTVENPTAGDSGASITDRLEKYLAADDSTPSPAPATQEAVPDTQAAQPETETPEKDAPEQVSQPQLTTSDLAKVLGIDESALDVDADGNVSIKTKIDGKEGAAKFADLLKTHQIQGHAENRAREVAQREAAFATRAQEAEQSYQQRLGQAEQLMNIAAQELLAEFNQYDWKALEHHEDQGAVAALKLKFRERNEKIQGAMQGINAQRGQMNQQAQWQNQQRLAAEMERLPTFIPEWKDQAVAQREGKEMIDWARAKGYSQETIDRLGTSTALDIATFRNAMLFDKLQTSKVAVENKVRTAPKIVKAGTPQTDSAQQSLRSLKANVTKTGGKNGSLEAYLMARGMT
jgi:hypothetical protein